MDLIYFAYGNVSVFDSQVLVLLNYYVETGIFNKIILIIGVRSEKDKKRYFKKEINKKIKLLFYRHYPQYPIIEKLTVRSIYSVLNKIENQVNYLIHVRNEILAYYVFEAAKKLKIRNKRIKIIADIRGVGFEQLMEYSKKSKLILLLKRIQRKKVFNSLGKIKNISVVSESLKNYIINNIDNPSLDISVNSCLATNNFQFNESDRSEIRNKLSINENEILFVLATGGNHAWQNTDKTINLLVKKGYKILNLSRKNINLDNVINIFIPYKEMPKYLSASDIAIVWREKSITNLVASPVKFSEYVCCGLPVITNDSVELIRNFIDTYNSGAVLKSIDDINEELLNSLLKIDRRKLAETGVKNFGIQTISSQYCLMYEKIK